ncbi:MAG: hypothetical protein LVQ96_03785 [Thermoplasmatales archaeon]|nr:hypothetical protein [Thermoplasmatales archaeon]MCW6170273.1 hypothetical protein [Thermoplasmatales archaeon]
MPRVGVFTHDFKFYHDSIQLLRRWNLPFASLIDLQNVPPDVKAVLSSSKDQECSEIQFKADTPREGLRKALPALFLKNSFRELFIGIDPGPYPGIAILADGILTEAYECSSPEKLLEDITGIIYEYKYEFLEVKMGNGDIPNRDYIRRLLSEKDIHVKVVDEKYTSFPHKLHDNALSAARIAGVEENYRISPEIQNGIHRKDAYDREFITLRRAIMASQN